MGKDIRYQFAKVDSQFIYGNNKKRDDVDPD